MASITIKDIPADLHRALKQRAEKNARSLQREAVLCLKQSVGMSTQDRADVLARVRDRRERMKTATTAKQVRQWLDEDRK